MTWQIDEDEEFGGALLRWNDEVIAQTTGEESDGCIDAYDELVRAVRLYQSLPDAEHIHVTRHPDRTITATPMRRVEVIVMGIVVPVKGCTADGLLGEDVPVWVDSPGGAA